MLKAVGEYSMLVSRHIAIAGLVLILRVFSLKWSWAFAQNAEDLPFSFPDLTPEQKAQFSQWLKDLICIQGLVVITLRIYQSRAEKKWTRWLINFIIIPSK
jgi:hypothetical protein